MFFVLIDAQRSVFRLTLSVMECVQCTQHAYFTENNPHIVKYIEKTFKCLIVATLKPHNLQYPLPLRHRIIGDSYIKLELRIRVHIILKSRIRNRIKVNIWCGSASEPRAGLGAAEAHNRGGGSKWIPGGSVVQRKQIRITLIRIRIRISVKKRIRILIKVMQIRKIT